MKVGFISAVVTGSIGLLMFATLALGQPDPNFYIYLCFGQSNMEGQGTIAQQDKTVDPRFQVMEAVNCSNLGRTKGNWYTATPPLCRCWSGLSPADYFGRTLVEHLPENIRVGVINVSVGGCKIELFDKDSYQDYVSSVTEGWLLNIIDAYDGNPYGHLVDLARLAQEDGIIKGILLHQGESNTGDSQWPAKVKKVYDDLIDDLGLDPNAVPLLAGEVVHEDQDGICASMNTIINTLPQAIPTAHVISSSGCTDKSDNLHFDAAGYRELGRRYATKMLSLLGCPTKWVGTWSTAQQLVESQNNPPSPGLSHNTLRQIVHVSLGSETVRVRFSNEFSSEPVTLNEVHMAVSLGQGMIDPNTDTLMTFAGEPNAIMSPGTTLLSAPFEFPLTPLSDVALTIYFGDTSADVTGHPGSRTTSYLWAGDQVHQEDFSQAVQTDHWYVIDRIDVKVTESAQAVVVLGDSITDGRGSGTNKQNRWPDELARRLQDYAETQEVAVLNAGIGGNAVLSGGLGPTALSRFYRDVIEPNSVQWLIILEGINDIGGSSGAEVAQELIDAYQQMIHAAHTHGIWVYGATLLPFGGSFYDSPLHETARQTVNDWIRTSEAFDAVIDLDQALRNPSQPTRLLPSADDGDHLHPSETGHWMMAEAVDVNLFINEGQVTPVATSDAVYLEAECGTVGANWETLADSQASNDAYVTVKAGIQSLSEATTSSEALITLPFTTDAAGTYAVYARINCPSYDDDSFWVTIDNEPFVMCNGLVTSGWQWLVLDSFLLRGGTHTLKLTYREDGAKLDKICISDSPYPPLGMGEEAENISTEEDSPRRGR